MGQKHFMQIWPQTSPYMGSYGAGVSGFLYYPVLDTLGSFYVSGNGETRSRWLKTRSCDTGKEESLQHGRLHVWLLTVLARYLEALIQSAGVW